MAACLWRWTAQSRQGRLATIGAVEVCRELDRGRLALAGRISDEDLARVIRLAQESGAVDRLLEQAPDLWRTAQSFWQIRLLLDLFPDVDFEPTVRHLEALVRQRGWLQEHLRRARLHPRRAELFRIALLGFHQAAYPADAGVQWRDEYASTILWAVFSGVPLAQQGGLAEALSLYAGSTAEEKIRCCQAYLAGQRHTDPFDEPVLRVLRDVVVPMLRRLPDAEIRRLFRLVLERESPPDTRWERFAYRTRRLWARLLGRMRVELGSGTSGFAFQVQGKRVVLSPWFHRFLEELVRDGAVRLLPAALAGRSVGRDL